MWAVVAVEAGEATAVRVFPDALAAISDVLDSVVGPEAEDLLVVDDAQRAEGWEAVNRGESYNFELDDTGSVTVLQITS